MNYPYKKAPSVVVARMARSGFAASGKPRIARGSSSPQKASVPFGDPKGLSALRADWGRDILIAPQAHIIDAPLVKGGWPPLAAGGIVTVVRRRKKGCRPLGGNLI